MKLERKKINWRTLVVAFIITLGVLYVTIRSTLYLFDNKVVLNGTMLKEANEKVDSYRLSLKVAMQSYESRIEELSNENRRLLRENRYLKEKLDTVKDGKGVNDDIERVKAVGE